ncbi:MAG: hypothetical protein WBV85_08075 [Solirubrobacteraceae bacterium]
MSLTLCAVALLGAGCIACGGASKTTGANSSTQAAPTSSVGTSSEKPADTPADKDKDEDSTGTGRYDSDDKAVLDFGHAASASEKEQITALVRSYYAIAAAQNGTKACTLLYSILAEAVPENYGISPPGPSYAHGKTCPEVLAAFFKHFHQQIVAKLPKLKVSRVRIKERQGVAVLSFGKLPESEMRVVREGHIWRIISVVDTELP